MKPKRTRHVQVLASCAALAALAGLAGCKQGPDYVRPPIPHAETYRQPTPSGESIANVKWWDLFQDPVLQDLIRSAIEENRDVRVALARIAEARAQAGFARADLYPRVDVAAGAAIGEAVTDEGDHIPTRGIFVAADVFYEVDLWGRIRRGSEAATQELLATEEAYRSVTITLVADVASLYLLLLDLDNRLDIAERTVEARRDSYEIMRVRNEAGMINEVDLNQSAILLADAEASVEAFRRSRAQTENALNVLLGRTPVDVDRGLKLTEQVFPPDVPAGLPADLVQRRPDILQAERRLAAQTARIGVAEALKLPTLSLTGSAGVSGDLAGGSLATGVLNLGANLLGPIFNAGKNERRVEIEVARTEQLLNQYQQTILNAFREVEDAIVATYTYRDEYEARLRQVQSATNAANLSWVRYEGGMTSYLEVLDLQRSQFSAELQASAALQQQLASVVQLYKALGGGWPVQPAAEVEPGTDAD